MHLQSNSVQMLSDNPITNHSNHVCSGCMSYSMATLLGKKNPFSCPIVTNRILNVADIEVSEK